MEKQQLVPRKHIGKSMNNKQESIVEWIQLSQNLRTMAEAKHEYFENQKKYDEEANIKEGRAVMETESELAEHMKAGEIEAAKKGGYQIEENVAEQTKPEEGQQSEVGTQETAVQKQKEERKKGPMTIAETKLGVTMVINKEQCEKLGIPGTSTTRDAIKELKKRLGVN